jgi:hypothetical protein
MADKILSDIISELRQYMSEDEAIEFAIQLLRVGAQTAPYRSETLDAVADRLRGQGAFQQ